MQESALKTRGLDNLSEEINGPGYRLKCLLDLKRQLIDLSDVDESSFEISSSIRVLGTSTI